MTSITKDNSGLGIPSTPPPEQVEAKSTFPFLKLPLELRSAIIAHTGLVIGIPDYYPLEIDIDLPFTTIHRNYSCFWADNKPRVGVEVTAGRVSDSLDEKHKRVEGVSSLQFRAESPCYGCTKTSVINNAMFKACTETRAEAMRIFFTSNHLMLNNLQEGPIKETIERISSVPSVYLKMITRLFVNLTSFWFGYYYPVRIYGPFDANSEADGPLRVKTELDETFRSIQDTFSTGRLQLQLRFGGLVFFDVETALQALDMIKFVLQRALAFKVGTVSVALRDKYFGQDYFSWHWHTFSGTGIVKNIEKAMHGGLEALVEKGS